MECPVSPFLLHWHHLSGIWIITYFLWKILAVKTLSPLPVIAKRIDVSLALSLTGKPSKQPSCVYNWPINDALQVHATWQLKTVAETLFFAAALEIRLWLYGLLLKSASLSEPWPQIVLRSLGNFLYVGCYKYQISFVWFGIATPTKKLKKVEIIKKSREKLWYLTFLHKNLEIFGKIETSYINLG